MTFTNCFNRLLYWIPVFLIGCSTASIQNPVEAGVSLQLAKHRKSTLSNIQYDLSLNVPASRKEPIKAAETITFKLSDAADDVVLDFKVDSPAIEKIVVNDKPADIDHQKEHLIISKSLLKQGVNSVSITFTAGESSLNRYDEFLYSLLVPERARTFFPCFDQPDLRAQFKVKMTVPQDWEAVSNAAVMNIDSSGTTRQITFATSDTFSTYLFSVVAGKFKKETRTLDKRVVNFYYRETDTARIKESIDPVFDLHLRSIRFMEEYTGVPYPFQKLDFIAIPNFQYGGMEHVGAIDYKAVSLFLDKTATSKEKYDRAHVIAHEVAHMWFGNMVTMKWFDDVWMKEVFANFMADKTVDNIAADSQADLRFVLQHFPLAYYVDRTKGANPIRHPLPNLNQAGSLYGSIIYDKAPIVMRQLEQSVGEEEFRNGMQVYMKKFAFGNAEWPDLISILDSISNEDISAWNEQWINRQGRPVISYSLLEKDGKVSGLTLTQKGEYELPGIWKQHFNIGFVYPDSIHTIPVNMDADSIHVRLEGLKVPAFILFNSTGSGYGSFPVDKKMLSNFSLLKDPLLRATAYINIYEKALDGETVSPAELLQLYTTNLNSENEDLVIARMTRQMRNIFWQFMSPVQRTAIAKTIEPQIWNSIATTDLLSKKRTLFQLLVSIGITDNSVDRIYSIWDSQKNEQGIQLAEPDYTTAAAELAIRKPANADSILAKQLRRITDKDRKADFEFYIPSLSANTAIRDSFFTTLLDKKNRKKENRAATTLEYLNHPLRNNWGIKYLRPSLDVLEEVQSTGDIFFPTAWLQATFGYYQTAQAAGIVKEFLDQHPDYNPNLKAKLLQETDDLFRAQKIVK
ncbi:MAG TPA: M1 family aminopeptidase [Chitinophagaceae bacterium]|jgi:aminopeptidase N|nr:M1 family aminopeptidase [Chitinophagaceae bacterium]